MGYVIGIVLAIFVSLFARLAGFDREETSKVRYEYKLLATSKTSTMQKEMQESGDAGFRFVGITVSKTAMGGKEVLTILRKAIASNAN